MGLKVWLDDVRPVPDDSWVLVETSYEAIMLLKYGEVDVISLDHDLGPSDTGQNVARFIASMETRPEVRIHSMNPVGAKAMRQILGMEG